MKQLEVALLGTVLLYLVTTLLLAPLMSNIGYSAVEGSYHLQTHALLVSLIFTVILCTLIGSLYIVEEVRKLHKEKDEAQFI